MYTGSYIQTHVYGHMYTDTYIQTHVYGHIYTDTYIRTHVYRHMYTDTYIQTHIYGHIYTDTYIQTHVYRHMYTDTYIRTHIYRHIYTDTYVQTHIYRHISDCLQTVHVLPLLPNDTAGEKFLPKSGAVRCVDWIFITWGGGLAVTWRMFDIGQNILQCSIPTGSSSSHSYFHMLFLIEFFEVELVRDIITLPCIYYNML